MYSNILININFLMVYILLLTMNVLMIMYFFQQFVLNCIPNKNPASKNGG